MSQKTLNTRIQHKHDIEANWEKATNFIPLQGEIIVYDVDENFDYQRIKIGDGVKNINELIFVTEKVYTQPVVRYDQQSLTEEQKVQARDNIDAASSAQGVYYIAGTGTTAGVWLGSHDDITEYYDGLMVAYKIPIGGASTTTLSINSLGAVKVVRNVTTAISTIYAADSIILLIYTTDSSGTSYWKVADYDSNTTYTNSTLGQGYGSCITAAATTAKTATLSNYTLATGGIVSIKFTSAVPANATLNINSKGAKSIYYKGQKITADIIKAGDVATFIYNGTYYCLIAIDRWQKDIADMQADIIEIQTDYETKADASSKLTEAKTYAEQLGLPIVTTGGDGAAYTATVPGITSLTKGTCFVMIPHVDSSSVSPTLNVNSLGAKKITRRSVCGSNQFHDGYSEDWLVHGHPLIVMYTSDSWINITMPKPVSEDISGVIPVSNGGTGKNSLQKGAYLLGNGTSAVTSKTSDEVREDILGGLYTLNLHDAFDESTVTMSVDYDVFDSGNNIFNFTSSVSEGVVLNGIADAVDDNDAVNLGQMNEAIAAAPSVKYDQQSLTEEQKAQARENIGAISETEVLITVEDIDTICNGTFQYVDVNEAVF